jgi:signal transduction histidine kinase
MVRRGRAFDIGLQGALDVHLQADAAGPGVAYRGEVMLRDWQHRLNRLSPVAVDRALALAVAATLALTVGIADEPDATRSPDALAYLIGVSVAALLLLRRRRPLGVLVGSIGLLSIYYGLGYPAFSAAVGLAVPAYSAALYGRAVPAAALLGAFVVVGGTVARLDEGESFTEVLRDSLITDAALLAAVLLLGEAVRNRRAWAEEVRGRLARAEQEREREAERRVQEERVRIAREMHDVLAHTIAAINVQAGVGADVIDDAPDKARESLLDIRRQSRDAIAELKATLGVLREDAPEAPREPAPGLAQLDGLIEMAGAAGLRVEFSATGEARPLPGTVDLTAYRVVQESLTNVIRHAHASVARVRVHFDAGTLIVHVEDDGVGTGNGAAGYGLIGMRERVAALGGTLEAGPAPGAGFRVHATLPTGEPPE